MKVTIIEDVTREDLVVLLSGVSAHTDKAVKLVPAEVEETEETEEVQNEETTAEEKPVRTRRRRNRSKKAKTEEDTSAAVEEAPAEETTAPDEEVAEPAEEEAPAEEESKTEEVESEEKEATPQVSRTDVINLGKKLVKAGHNKEVSALMKDTFGAKKFSDISDDQLPEVYKAFKEIENLRQYVEIALKHDYMINADEKQMIVDVLKQYVNTDGKIITSIFEVANQSALLDGEYEGYRVLFEEDLQYKSEDEIR